MEINMLLLFSVISIILFFIIIILDDEWRFTMPLIMVNLIFITIAVYGYWNVEWIYVDGTGVATAYQSTDYAVYSYVFVGLWLMHLLLIIKAAGEALKEAANTKGQFSYRRQAKMNRSKNKYEY